MERYIVGSVTYKSCFITPKSYREKLVYAFEECGSHGKKYESVNMG